MLGRGHNSQIEHPRFCADVHLTKLIFEKKIESLELNDGQHYLIGISERAAINNVNR